MSATFYEYLHHIGLIVSFIAIGGLGALAMTGQNHTKARPPFVAMHGTGLVIILVAGFGWLANLPYGSLPVWAILKLVVWVVLGAIIVPFRRAPGMARPLTVFVVPALALFAAAIGVWHVQIFNG